MTGCYRSSGHSRCPHRRCSIHRLHRRHCSTRRCRGRCRRRCSLRRRHFPMRRHRHHYSIRHCPGRRRHHCSLRHHPPLLHPPQPPLLQPPPPLLHPPPPPPLLPPSPPPCPRPSSAIAPEKKVKRSLLSGRKPPLHETIDSARMSTAAFLTRAGLRGVLRPDTSFYPTT